MAVFFLVLLFAIIITFEVPKLARQGKVRELWAFGVVTLLAMVFSFGLALQLPLPSITRGIEMVMEPLFKVLEGLFLS